MFFRSPSMQTSQLNKFSCLSLDIISNLGLYAVLEHQCKVAKNKKEFKILQIQSWKKVVDEAFYTISLIKE